MNLKLLLVCFGGFSSSLLAKRIETGLAEYGYEAKVFTEPVEVGLRQISNYDVVLVAPQVRHMTKKVQEVAAKSGKPTIEVAMAEYPAPKPTTLIDRIVAAVKK